MDIDTVRSMFPGLTAAHVRLDGPAAAQTPQAVLDAITGYLRDHNANIGAVFGQSTFTGELVAEARRVAAAFIDAEPDEVGFGLNATSLNWSLARTAAAHLRPGDEVVVTALDHEANLTPWSRVADERGLVVRQAGLAADTRLDPVDLASLIGPRTAIVAFPYANNAIGTLVDVAEVVRLARRAGALTWADATHWAAHGPIRARELDVDVAVCSAYKYFGPHVGVGFVRRELARDWGVEPAGYEHGTLPYPFLAGLIAAIGHVHAVGWDAIADHERALGERFLAGLSTLSDRMRLHGPQTMAHRTPTFALTLPGRRPAESATRLAAAGIAAGSGRFGCSSVLDALGLTEGVLRLGFLHYNTTEEVDRALTALAEL